MCEARVISIPGRALEIQARAETWKRGQSKNNSIACWNAKKGPSVLIATRVTFRGAWELPQANLVLWPGDAVPQQNMSTITIKGGTEIDSADWVLEATHPFVVINK
jgi:hypothetical protein